MGDEADWEELSKILKRAQDRWPEEAYEEKLHRPMGREWIAEGDFSGLHWQTFEKLIAHLLICSERDAEVGVLPLPSGGYAQGGCDILVYQFGENLSLKAFEAKHSKDKFTAPELIDAVNKFADNKWFGLVDEFTIITSGLVCEKAIQEHARLSLEWQENYNKKLYLKGGDHVMDMLFLNPEVANRLLPLADCDRIFREAKLRHQQAFWREHLASAHREVSLEEASQQVAADLAANLSEPKITKGRNTHTWENNVVRLFTLLPREESFFGSCAITINLPNSQGVTFTFGQNDILTRLWSGTGLPIESKCRKFVMSLAHDDQRAHITFGGSSCVVPKPVCQALCDAVDAMLPHYLNALRSLEKAWGLSQLKLEWSTKFGDLNVVLCRMPAALWDLILRFARDHDYDAGKSQWHIFDANHDRLKIYTPEARGNLNPGYHLFLHAVADVNRYSWRNPGEDVDIVWGLPSQYMVGPVDDQNYWSASTALEWLQDRLMPALKTWMWSRRSKFNRFKLRVKRQGPNNELPPNLIIDYRKSNSVSLPEKPDRKSLEDLSSKLQSAYASSEIEDHVEVPHESYSAVVDATIRVLKYANPGEGPLSYMGGNNGIQAAGYEGFLSALAEQSKTLQRPDSPRRPIEMYLRSLLDALGHLKQELSPFDAEVILEALEPMVAQSNEFKFVRRHWAVNE